MRALVGATLIDGTGAQPLQDAVILTENGRIGTIGPRSQTAIPDGVETKDLTGLTLLPGLIDSHVHLNFALPRGPFDPHAEATIDAVLSDFVRQGVTSIRDVGAGYPWLTELARSIKADHRKSPRSFAAGDPLRNISHIRKIRLVTLGGSVMEELQS